MLLLSFATQHTTTQQNRTQKNCKQK